MANYTSTHTGAVIDASVTKVSSSGVTQADLSKLNAVTSSATELNLLDGVTATTAEINILDGVTATAAEINILDGVTSTTAELNILDGVTSTATELNLLDGVTGGTVSASLAVVVDSNKDIGTFRNLTLSGNLNAGAIVSSGDVTIDADGADLILKDGGTEYGRLSNVLGGLTLKSGSSAANAIIFSTDGNAIFAGSIAAPSLDISGDVDIDGTLETDALTINGVASVPFESADHSKLDGIESNATADQTASEIRTLVDSASDSNVFTDADHSKLDGIEASADVTDTANVTSAGALMDSELTSIADVKALDQSVISGSSPTFGTANMTDASNKRFMTDAQETKLDSVESNADVTDTTNVTAAGAVMDSEVTDLDGIKSLTVPNSTTISTFGASLVDDASASAARTTLGVDAAGTDNSTDVTLVTSSHDYLSLSGQAITLGTIDIGDDTNLAGGTGIDLTGDTLSIDSTVATLTGSQTLTNKTIASPTFTGDINFTDASTPVFNVTDTTNTVTTKIQSANSSGLVGTSTDHNFNVIRNNVSYILLQDGTIMVNNPGSDIDVNIKDSSANSLFRTDAANSRVGILDATPSYTLDVNGTGRFTGAVQLDDNLTVTGDLTVNGTTTTVNQTNLDVSDNIIGLNRGASTNANDSGLIIERGSTGDNAAIIWDESADKFTLGTTTSTPSATGNLSVSTGTLVANLEGDVTGNADTATTLTGLTSTVAELNYSDGVTSNIQTQIDALPDTAGTGIDISSTTISVDVSDFMTNGADNRVLTATGTDAFRGEGNLTFDGSTLAVTGALTTTSTINIGGVATFQNHLELGDSDKIKLGTSGDLEIYHDGTDDIINTKGNAFKLLDNGTERLRVTAAGHIIINENGNDQNFRVEGNTNADLLKVDAGLDRVGIGVGTPTDTFQVEGSIGVGVGRDGQLTSVNNGLAMRSLVSDADMYFYVNDGGVDTLALKIDASDAGTLLPNNNIRMGDSKKIRLGASNDFNLYHDGSNSYIYNESSAGKIIIQNTTSDGDIEIKVNDGGATTNAIIIDASDNARVKLPNDNQRLSIGASNDIQITHDGSNSYIDNYTGHLTIKSNDTDKDIILSSDDGSGGETAYLTIDGSLTRNVLNVNTRVPDSVIIGFGGADDLQLFHNGTNSFIENYTGALFLDNKTSDQDIYFKVNDGGSTITALRIDASAVGTVRLPNDSQQLIIGAGDDLRIQHNGSHSFIQQYGTGDLYFDNNNDNQGFVFRTDDGSGGVTTYLKIDGDSSIIQTKVNNRFDDSKKLLMGGGSDLHMYHDGTHSYLYNYTGDFKITSFADDKDIIFSSDDGSGGTTAYLTLDGSAERIQFSKKAYILDNVKFEFGDGADLQIYHDGSNSSLQNNTGVFYINQTANASMSLQTNNTQALEITSAQVLVPRQDVKMQAGKKLYFDGGGDTYIHNPSGDTIDIVAGGQQMLRLFEGGTDYVHTDDNVRLGVGNSPDFYIYHDATNTHQINTTGDLYIKNAAQDEDIYFQVNDGGSTTTVMTIDGATANVGIGTGSPDTLLHINEDDAAIAFKVTGGSGGSKIAQFIRDVGVSSPYAETYIHASSGDPQITFRDAGNQYYSIGLDDSDNSFKISDNSAVGTNDRLTIDTSGNVGIGETSPDTLLHIKNTGSGGTTTLKLEDNAREMYLGRDSIKVTELDGSTAAQLYINSNTTFSGTITVPSTLNANGNIYLADDQTLYVGTDTANGIRMFHLSSNNNNYFRSNGGALSIETMASKEIFLNINNTNALAIDTQRNLKIFDNGTNPTASANNAFLFCDSGELKVLDELGNTTTISPHNFDLIPGGASEDRAWGYYSEKDIKDEEGNVTSTQKVNVDMMKLARLVEQLTGEKLVYTEEDE